MIFVTALSFGAGAEAAFTSFDTGAEGWSISGRDTVLPTGGNGGANLYGQLIDVFGADIRNNINGDYLGDLTRYGQAVEFSIDIKTNSITSFGNPVPRELVLELRDYDNDNGLPWTSVWISLGGLFPTEIGGSGEWETYSVTIDDMFATELPGAWGGYGDEDPNTFEPILPADRTFTSVLQSVDEIAFTTFVPGFFFGFTDMDLQVDNISIRTVPAPSATVFGALGLGILSRRRRV